MNIIIASPNGVGGGGGGILDVYIYIPIGPRPTLVVH